MVAKSRKERFLRKKYIGECRRASRVMTTIMVRFPMTATTYRARNRARVGYRFADHPEIHPARTPAEASLGKLLFLWGDMALIMTQGRGQAGGREGAGQYHMVILPWRSRTFSTSLPTDKETINCPVLLPDEYRLT